MALYIVPVPIGNLKDITLRAIDVLNAVDFIIVEDTRYSLKLLNNLGIKKNFTVIINPVRKRRPNILSNILKGRMGH